MEWYLYQPQGGLSDFQMKIVDSYLTNNLHIIDFKSVEDEGSPKLHWTNRPLNILINNLLPGDILVSYEPSHLARSTSQILDIFCIAKKIGFDLHFVRFSDIFNGSEKQENTNELLNLVIRIESQFVSKRTTEALLKRKNSGLPLGRPLGRKNKSLKLDCHRDEISKYLKAGINRSQIAKIIKCHPQTLFDWIVRTKPEIKS